MVSIMLLLASTFAVLSIGFANAAFLEDYSDTATKKTLDRILKYCASTPNANISLDLINSGNISQFYSDYTCNKAAQDRPFLKADDPDAQNATTINLLH